MVEVKKDSDMADTFVYLVEMYALVPNITLGMELLLDLPSLDTVLMIIIGYLNFVLFPLLEKLINDSI